MIGFQDESSPQTTANTVRLWSPVKPHIVKNTDKLRANLFGFYPLNGKPVIESPINSKKEDMMAFLRSVREANDDKPVVMILDNNSTHHARDVTDLAASLDIRLVFLPPYSPDLNPIEFIWKSLKRTVSKLFFPNREEMVRELEARFMKEASKSSYAGDWRAVFLSRFIVKS